jgi:O-acetyl-ADP-ribose deacetylase (regulator of RNase III)
MKIEVVKGDITEVATQAIVNAANSSLMGGGGVDGAIHRKGGKAILEACIKIRNAQGGCKTGEAVITTSGNLPSDYVIHTVGPVWQGGNKQEAALLENCYENVLKLASEHKVSSIAFPNISTGIYRYPQREAALVALKTVKKFDEERVHQIEKLVFVCFDERNYTIYQELLKDA